MEPNRTETERFQNYIWNRRFHLLNTRKFLEPKKIESNRPALTPRYAARVTLQDWYHQHQIVEIKV